MSGHSKWHSIKHEKGAADAARGKLFARLVRQIEVAARERRRRRRGATRRCARWCRRRATRRCRRTTSSARSSGAPVSSRASPTSRSPTRATRRTASRCSCEALTDNRNRTGAEIKNIFTRNGGSLAEPGAVAWQFERKGVVILDKRAATEDDLMLAALDAGAEDIEDLGDTWQVTTAADRPARGARPRSRRPASRSRAPTSRCCRRTTVALDEASTAKSVLRVIDALEEHDDVQNVYANFDIPDDVLAGGLRVEAASFVGFDSDRLDFGDARQLGSDPARELFDGDASCFRLVGVPRRST